ncbi:MAG TPA: hypothetical protein VMF69_28450 [Gemmataceae bacterium]|nr:hypothetical protein [Gemmataceae bacterium]
MTRLSRRLTLILACTVALVPLFVTSGVRSHAERGNEGARSKIEHYKGKVKPLADLLAKTGAQLDADAAPYWLALAGEDGKIYPLVKDSGSRMFFQDRELLNRPIRLTGRLLPNSQLLQVTAVHSYVKGELNEIYYWCEVCSIRRGEKNACECCGGPMVRREEPVKK